MRIRSSFERMSEKVGQKRKDITAYIRMDHQLNEDVDRVVAELELDRSTVLRELAKCSIALYREGPIESTGVTSQAMEAFTRLLSDYNLENVDVVKMMIMLKGKVSNQLDLQKGKTG